MPPVFAGNCNNSPVFAFSRALYLDDYVIAQDLLPRIGRERSAEMAQFLQQVLVFKRAYEQENLTQQHTALQRIDSLIDSLSSKPVGQRRYDERLMLANIMIHSARLQLTVGDLLRAANLAKQGRQLLDEMSEQVADDTDALLSNGLYAYYTGSENEALGWMMRWWSLRGDKAQGRAMMEKAVEESVDYAFEAARSLVVDVAWNRSDSCRYRRLFDDINEVPQPLNDAVKTQIGLALFCGDPQFALRHIDRLNSEAVQAGEPLSQAHSSWLFAAQVYALAAQGNDRRLQSMLLAFDPKKNVQRYWQTQFSLAKAFDTLGLHDKAAGVYQAVMASDVAQPYRDLARSYRQLPYRKPSLYQSAPGEDLQFACGG